MSFSKCFPLALAYIHNQVKDLGMTLTEKWSTDNTLNTTVDVADKLLPGLKVGRKTMIMNS